MASWKPNFDLSDPIVPVRLICGLLYVPHIAFKLTGMAGAVAFFGKVGLNPAWAFVILALTMETICAVALTFDVFTKWAGFLSAAVLAVACYAVISAKGFVWLWNLGGIEFNVVWAALSCLVALHAWKREAATYGRVSLLIPRAA